MTAESTDRTISQLRVCASSSFIAICGVGESLDADGGDEVGNIAVWFRACGSLGILPSYRVISWGTYTCSQERMNKSTIVNNKLIKKLIF